MISDFLIFLGKWLQGKEKLRISSFLIYFGKWFKSKKKDNKAKIWGAFFTSFGLIAIIIPLYIDEYHKKLALTEHRTLTELSTLSLKFSEHVGVALIVLGLVSFFVDFNSWRKYFQERLAETIVKRDYLKTLRKEQLISLQTDTLVAFFETEDIRREDSFLEFFRARLQTFIASPYREDTDNTMLIRFEDDKTKEKLVVEDIISYKCKKVGKCIQESIRWENEELGEIQSFKVTLEIPEKIFNLPEMKRKYKHQKIVIEKDNKRLKKIEGEKGYLKGYILRLANYKEIDGLWVEVRGKYVVEKSELIYFKMAHPSHKLTVTVNYPKELELSTGFFGVAEGDLRKKHTEGVFSINYDSWMLPHAGFTFQFRDKKPAPAGNPTPPINGTANTKANSPTGKIVNAVEVESNPQA